MDTMDQDKIGQRLTPEHIDRLIVSEAYYRFPGTPLTVAALTLLNGFMVVGESASGSLARFSPETGRKVARDNARNKVFQLEAYALRTRAYGAEKEEAETSG